MDRILSKLLFLSICAAVDMHRQLQHGSTLAEINSILRIECAKTESHTAMSSRTSTVEISHVPERDLIINLAELSLDVDPFIASSSTSLVDTTDREIPLSLAEASATTSVVATMTPTTAKPTLQHFDLLERLGEGAFGTVFLARHKPSGVRVALKAISKVPHGEGSIGNLEWGEGILEERARHTPGNNSWAIEASTLAECCALRRTRGEKNIL